MSPQVNPSRAPNLDKWCHHLSKTASCHVAEDKLGPIHPVNLTRGTYNRRPGEQARSSAPEVCLLEALNRLTTAAVAIGLTTAARQQEGMHTMHRLRITALLLAAIVGVT